MNPPETPTATHAQESLRAASPERIDPVTTLQGSDRPQDVEEDQRLMVPEEAISPAGSEATLNQTIAAATAPKAGPEPEHVPVSAASTGTVIVAVLRVCEGRTLPQLPINITLNTFLAFFTTFAKASLITFVNEALSQWKWNMASAGADTKVYEFDMVDTASRGGPWGSFVLVQHFRWKHLVTVAGFLALISVLTSPITQQLISYPLRLGETTLNATTPFTRHYGPDKALSDRISDATLNRRDSQDPLPYTAVSCASTNCTFEPFRSVAVCLRTRNITDLLEVVEIPNSTYKDWSHVHEVETLSDVVLDGPVVQAWRVSLPSEVDLELVTPLSWAYVISARSVSLSFKDPNENFTALSTVYQIWCNARNVSYEAGFLEGNSKTRILSSSSAVLNISENQPLDNLICAVEIPGERYNRLCRYKSQARDIGLIYLQDPEAPDDLSRYYSGDRQLLSIAEEYISVRMSTG
ncbi:hypothetical protein OQA88_9190 [Cercophora sp. LCS_1]